MINVDVVKSVIALRQTALSYVGQVMSVNNFDIIFCDHKLTVRFIMTVHCTMITHVSLKPL